ncbi:hypothetical protein CALCODRAFT_356424 [Calocera cornea HHB12733]|uniref:Uncharacterized protein n=1 Tax=Calocera cornea HHB12733 TaxID=1353952 RepID=A0A165ENN2_9BASI|nr:hypothetical protein CALCODRAFT_356424 [Calocera cornea HHB12733]
MSEAAPDRVHGAGASIQVWSGWIPVASRQFLIEASRISRRAVSGPFIDASAGIRIARSGVQRCEAGTKLLYLKLSGSGPSLSFRVSEAGPGRTRSPSRETRKAGCEMWQMPVGLDHDSRGSDLASARRQAGSCRQPCERGLGAQRAAGSEPSRDPGKSKY